MPKPIFWTPLYFGLEILNLSTKNIFIRFILGKYFRFILKFFFVVPSLDHKLCGLDWNLFDHG
jgi:hypothetical protein